MGSFAFSSHNYKQRGLTVWLLVLALGSVGGGLAAGEGDAVRKALHHKQRPAADFALDEARKPAEVLKFFGIKPGMQVIDVFAGPGWYTEILNHLVGAKGGVTMYTHTTWEHYSKKKSDLRIADGRLKHTRQLVADINTLQLPAQHYDAALMILGFHDLFLTSEKSASGDALNPDSFLRALYLGLKPGGVMGVVEHLTAPGTPGNPDLHRMSAAEVRRAFAKAGFVLEAEADMLRNPKDQYEKSVFHDEVRRKTDRTVMLFRKPLGKTVKSKFSGKAANPLCKCNPCTCVNCKCGS